MTRRESDANEARDWLARALDEVESPTADAEAREALRTAFLAAARTTPATTLASRSRNRFRLVSGVLAFAAAMMLVFVLTRRVPEHRFELLEPASAGLTIDGRIAQRTGSLTHGSTLESADLDVVVRVDEVYLLELGAASSARVSFDDDEQSSTFDLSVGALRISTKSGFTPRQLRVRTAEVEVSVVGTAFGVDILPGMGTCVCCEKGHVNVTTKTGEVHRLGPGAMIVCAADAQPTMSGPAKVEHLRPIERLESRE